MEALRRLALPPQPPPPPPKEKKIPPNTKMFCGAELKNGPHHNPPRTPHDLTLATVTSAACSRSDATGPSDQPAPSFEAQGANN